MHSVLVKSWILYVEFVSNRPDIIKNNLNGFPLPDNQPFSQGELVEIKLSMFFSGLRVCNSRP